MINKGKDKSILEEEEEDSEAEALAYFTAKKRTYTRPLCKSPLLSIFLHIL